MNIQPLSSKCVRIAFVDDHPTLLRGIAGIFEENDGFEIVGTGVTAEAAVELAAEKSPDILIVDLSMPGDVFAAITSILDCSPATKIVVFTAFADVDLALKAIDAGAHAFVLKGRPFEDLFDAIAAVRAGELFVSPDFAPKLMAGFRNRTQREKDRKQAKLSARELQIVACLLEGMPNKEIARKLELSEKTVKHYMTNLMNKLRVKSRLEVVLAAKRLSDGSIDIPARGDQA